RWANESAMKLKALAQWAEAAGASPPPWINGDWQTVMSVLARLLADNLIQRKHSEEMVDVTFKIAFDSMMQLAQDVLGIPLLVTEADLPSSLPNLNLALLTALVCIKSSVDVEPKAIRKVVVPKLVFEARYSARREQSAVTCAVCAQHVFIIERIVVDHVIYHRKCFKCSRCDELLRHGLFRQTKGAFECIQHWPMAVLGQEKLSTSRHPKAKPPPPPKPKNLSNPVPQPTVIPELVYEDACENDPAKKAGVTVLNHDEVVGNLDNACTDTDKSASELVALGGLRSRKDMPVVISPESTVEVDEKGEVTQHGEQEIVRMRTVEKTNTSLSAAEVIPDDPSTAPIPPPRPKRKSMLLNASPNPLRTQHLPDKPVPIPRSTNIHKPSLTGERSRSASPQCAKTISVVDYPDFLNPFGSEDEGSADESDSYDEALNPFGSGSDDEVNNAADDMKASLSVNPPNGTRSPATPLPGISDRPKSQPPPPPKPPRPLLEAANAQSAIVTLPRSRKNCRPPLAAIPTRRKIIFTENECDELSVEPIMDRVRVLDKELDVVEVNGKCIEKELLFAIEQNGCEWVKNRRVDDWIDVVEKRCELDRQQSAYIIKWLEKYLNEVHSDTEYQLRCLIERVAEKTPFDVEREAKLLELLVEIINEKNRLIESRIDSSALIDSFGNQAEKNETSKKRIKKRLKKLRKKVKMYARENSTQ
uniref:LIM zinc-binding domain-containing protein n=1 Tax=Parascaris univalens TaxID=6257 RepID=A0A915A912_PARUN